MTDAEQVSAPGQPDAERASDALRRSEQEYDDPELRISEQCAPVAFGWHRALEWRERMDRDSEMAAAHAQAGVERRRVAEQVSAPASREDDGDGFFQAPPGVGVSAPAEPTEAQQRRAHAGSLGMTIEQQLLECEEALRMMQQEYAGFRERMLEPIKGTEGKSIESMSWDELLGVATRNLNLALSLDRALRTAINLLDADSFDREEINPLRAALSESPVLAERPFADRHENRCPCCKTGAHAIVQRDESTAAFGEGEVRCTRCGTKIRDWDAG